MINIQLRRIINVNTAYRTAQNIILRLSNFRLQNSSNLAAGIQIFPRLHRPNSTIFHSITGSPSSSCEMVIFRNKSREENFRVCMGIFTAALRNKRCWQILHKNTSPYFHSAMLVLWPFTLFQRGHFSALSISKFTTPKRRTWKWITRQNGLLITKWAVRQQAMQCEVFLFIIWLNFNL